MPDERKIKQVDNLQRAAALRDRLLPVLMDSEIHAELQRIERGLIEEMIAAPTTEKRDRAAAEVKAWRAMWATLTKMSEAGRYASDKLHRMAEKNDQSNGEYHG